MKNPCSKSKSRIHLAPSPLALLPAAILALVAAMSCEDREVLAYLLLRSTRTPASMAQERRKCRKQDAPHRPLLDCPCFDCYTCFWTRWDASPHRELINDAIDAFEEQLAKGETAKKGGGRRRDRRAAPAAATEKPAEVLVEAAVFPAAEDVKVEVEAGWEATLAPTAEEEADVAAPAAEIRTATAGRKGWPDVMGILNLRLWGLWNPYI